jgi:glycosyltransferase involved in cell wall biosynthesis
VAVNRSVYRALREKGWKIEILIPDKFKVSGQYIYPESRTDSDPPIHRLTITSDQLRLHTYKGLISLLDRLRPKMVLLDNDPASRLAIELGVWTRLNKSYLICQSCENMSRKLGPSFSRAGIKGLLKSFFIQLLSMLAKPNIKHLFVINADGVQVFKDLGYDGKVSEMPLGFDPMLFYPDRSKREQVRKALRLDRVTVAYFGRLTKEKGVHLLIQALKDLMDLEWQLLLDRFEVYSDEYQEYIHTLIVESGISSRVVFFDAKHEEMPSYMNAADIVVLPSISSPNWQEQYGRVAAEAMACGCTTIVSTSGNLPNLVGDSGLYFNENDVSDLRNVLRKVITNPALRSSFSEKGCERSHALLSVIKQAQILDTFFKKL